jgi:hypothetical protein
MCLSLSHRADQEQRRQNSIRELDLAGSDLRHHDGRADYVGRAFLASGVSGH